MHISLAFPQCNIASDSGFIAERSLQRRIWPLCTHRLSLGALAPRERLPPWAAYITGVLPPSACLRGGGAPPPENAASAAPAPRWRLTRRTLRGVVRPPKASVYRSSVLSGQHQHASNVAAGPLPPSPLGCRYLAHFSVPFLAIADLACCHFRASTTDSRLVATLASRTRAHSYGPLFQEQNTSLRLAPTNHTEFQWHQTQGRNFRQGRTKAEIRHKARLLRSYDVF